MDFKTTLHAVNSSRFFCSPKLGFSGQETGLNRSFILTAPVFPVHDEANLMKRQAMLRPLLEQGGGPGAG